MTERSDEAFAADVAGGDASALRALYERHEGRLFNFLTRVTGSREAAQDVMQETFTRVWTMARTFDPARGRFKAWLFTIALNLARREMTRAPRRAVHVEAGQADLRSDERERPDACLARSEEQQRVAAAVGRLAPHLREVVVMKIYQQLKFREIAEITRTPEGTLKARFHRAVAELKESLGDFTGESHG